MTAAKTCFKCHKEKPLDEFYKHPMMADGHLGKCKDCTKADTLKNYIEKTEGVVKRRVFFIGDEHKKASKERWRISRLLWADRNKEKVKQIRERRRSADAILKKAWAKRNPEKVKANRLVAYAVRIGKIKRCPCSVCGAEKAHAHHEDYSKPLEIVWLCPKHHMERHAEIKLNTSRPSLSA